MGTIEEIRRERSMNVPPAMDRQVWARAILTTLVAQTPDTMHWLDRDAWLMAVDAVVRYAWQDAMTHREPADE